MNTTEFCATDTLNKIESISDNKYVQLFNDINFYSGCGLIAISFLLVILILVLSLISLCKGTLSEDFREYYSYMASISGILALAGTMFLILGAIFC